MSLKTKTLQAGTCIGLLLGAAQAAAVSLDFQVSTDPIQVGDTFTVDVILRDVFSGAEHGPTDYLTSFGFDWDLSVPSLLAAVGDPVMTPDFSPPYELVDFRIADVLAFAASSAITNDSNPVDALITRFEFTALQAGSTVLSIDGSVPDPTFERGLIYDDIRRDAVGFAGEATLNVERVPVPGTCGWPGSPGAAADEAFTVSPTVVLDNLSLNYCLPLGTGTCRQMQFVDLRAGFR